jgi:hypothetical protein
MGAATSLPPVPALGPCVPHSLLPRPPHPLPPPQPAPPITCARPTLPLPRHGILVTLSRPWYTFDVFNFVPIAIQTVLPIVSDGEEEGEEEGAAQGSRSLSRPKAGGALAIVDALPEGEGEGEGEGGEGGAGGAGGEGGEGGVGADDAEEPDPQTCIEILDCHGECVFDYRKSAYVGVLVALFL